MAKPLLTSRPIKDGDKLSKKQLKKLLTKITDKNIKLILQELIR